MSWVEYRLYNGIKYNIIVYPPERIIRGRYCGKGEGGIHVFFIDEDKEKGYVLISDGNIFIDENEVVKESRLYNFCTCVITEKMLQRFPKDIKENFTNILNSVERNSRWENE